MQFYKKIPQKYNIFMQVYDFVLGHMQPVDNRLDIPDLYNESEGIELVTKNDM